MPAKKVLSCNFSVPVFIQVVRPDGVSTVVHVTISVQASNPFQGQSAHARQRQTLTSLKSSQTLKTASLLDCWRTTFGLGTVTKHKRDCGFGTILGWLEVTPTGTFPNRTMEEETNIVR